MADKFWVSTIASNWNNTANWSLSSGGPGGAPVPVQADTAYFDSSARGPCSVDAVASVTKFVFNGYNAAISGALDTTNLDLQYGYVSDATVRVAGDVYGRSTYGAWSPGNSMIIAFNGDSTTDPQHLYNGNGCVLPTIMVDNTVIPMVMLDGTGPLLINGDFRLMSGTVNTNGLDIQVGR